MGLVNSTICAFWPIVGPFLDRVEIVLLLNIKTVNINVNNNLTLD